MIYDLYGGRGEIAVYLGDYQITIVERGSIEMDQNVSLTQFRDLCSFVEFQTVEAVLALDGPLFGSGWCHWRIFRNAAVGFQCT